eukprot:TRINITY_DN78954_c0_g1_i1.p1 TRINITY_DN78954_c0_g1~~TRINITY_DN78954_c0_g1_i1.p1  ORF type:complete len:178 (+),score=31.65 TRINITY_DN78954_c0_g1_i1:56-589(+)
MACSQLRALQLAMLVPLVDSMKCPGSGSWIHASCRVVAQATATCSEVAAEINARASHQQGWVDPHNGGIYRVLRRSDAEIQTERKTNPATSVGGKIYTDKQTFTLRSFGGGCKISACSESQGFSVADFSTNYCNIRNLYCGSKEGCHPVLKDFSTTEESVSPSAFAGKDKGACIVRA